MISLEKHREDFLNRFFTDLGLCKSNVAIILNIYKGMSYKECATALEMSVAGVAAALHKIYKKLNIDNRKDLIVFCSKVYLQNAIILRKKEAPAHP